MSNKATRIQKYLKKLHSKQCNVISTIKNNITVQIQHNKLSLESKWKDKKYIELFGKIYELDVKLTTLIDKKINDNTDTLNFDLNDNELIDGLKLYKDSINNILTTIKHTYGYNKTNANNSLEEDIKREEKKIIGYKVLIKENKRELANIDNKINDVIRSEEEILTNEVVRIVNKMADENNELDNTLYLEFEKKIDMEDNLKDAQERYNKLSVDYKSAKVQSVKSNKNIKVSLDNKKTLQRKYNKDIYLLNSQIDGIAKDKVDLTKLINGDGKNNKTRLQRRLQQLIEEEEYVKTQQNELHKEYLDELDKYNSSNNVQQFIKIKREMETINNHIKQIKHEMNCFSSKYINPIYDAYITRILTLIEQFNAAKDRRAKVDERTNETRNETIEKCSKMITSYGNKIIDCNNKIKEIKNKSLEEDNNMSLQIKDIQWYDNIINEISTYINEFMKNRTEINSLS